VAPRATWKGFVQISELSVPVALYAAASTAERISFHIINRKTGNRVRREYIDEKTEKPVERDQQVKGYETDNHRYVILEPEEIEAVIPESDKALRIEAFVEDDDVDTVYFDRPYFIAPSDSVARESFAMLCKGMKKKGVVAIAKAVLFKRLRTVMLRERNGGIVANTLNFDYEVRSAEDAFEDLPEIKIQGEMLDLAKHIIGTMKGKFDPAGFDDRYDSALAELIKAKLEGREIKIPGPPKETKVINLLEALRQSAKTSGKAPKKTAEPERRRKAS
jgi:DNA end-binding protein Ku